MNVWKVQRWSGGRQRWITLKQEEGTSEGYIRADDYFKRYVKASPTSNYQLASVETHIHVFKKHDGGA